jgi:hypothetical protein
LQTSHGKRQFKNVWYVLNFGNTRLISVWELNKSGILVKFENCVAIALVVFTGETFFRAVAYEGLYTLELVLKGSLEHAKESHDSQPKDKSKDTDTLPANLGNISNDIRGEESKD